MDSPVARFVREIGDEHLMQMSPARFDDAMIRTYLESRPGGRSFTAEQIDLIARFTRGLPLAVSFTATLLDGGQPVEEACRDIDDGHPSTVISQLARRYLVHAETREVQDAYPPGDPRRNDVTKILALALAYGNVRDDPDLLAALWDTSDPLATFQDLARRHDFVLPGSRRLHDDVRDTLRTDLLDPYRRLRARPVNERALNLFTTRLADMGGRWPGLDDQLGHAEFTTALLGALWHATWISNQDGLDLLTAILPILAAAAPRTADAAAAIVGQFTGTYTPDQERHLDQLTQRRPSLFDFDDLPDDFRPRRRRTATRRARITMDGLAAHPTSSAEDEPPLGQQGDHRAAIHILRARLQVTDHHDAAAVASLQTAAADTTSILLRQAIGTQALDIADRFIWPDSRGMAVHSEIGLAAAKIAAGMLPNHAMAWRSYGSALRKAGRLEEALAAHDQAVTLEPDNADLHVSRGITLQDLGRVEDALAAHDKAVELNPKYSYGYTNRGSALQALGRFEDALAAYDHAIALNSNVPVRHINKGVLLAMTGHFDRALAEFDTAERLDPSRSGEARACAGAILWHRRDAAAARDCFARVRGHVKGPTPFQAAELEAIALCGLGQLDSAEQYLLSRMPQRHIGDRADPTKIYDLLADPPLPGLDRLRAIIDNGST